MIPLPRTKTVVLLVLFSLTIFNTLRAQTKIISQGDEWQYYDDQKAPPIGWEKLNNNTNKWKTGISPLGYGDSFVTTSISFGKDSLKKDIVKYFKKTFRIEKPFEYIVYKINIHKDDGIVLYLNGKEITRIDMPDKEITNDTKATSLIISGEAEEYVHTIVLAPDDFIAGLNTLAASIHQGSSNSEDCIFSLELIGDSNYEMLPLLMKKRTMKNLSLDFKIKELKHKQELDKSKSKLEALEHSKNNIKTFLFIFIVLLVIGMAYAYQQFKNFKAKEDKLQRDISNFKEINNNKDLEMMSISMNSLNDKQYLKELKKDLEKSVKGGDATSMKKEIKSIVSHIKYNLDHNDDWENLKKHFNAVYTGFYDKLIELHPTLSEVELRHCIFIKLHMQTKEIANILHIDARSVQASRYRIKKKMNLSENTDLKDYLLKFQYK